MEFKTITKHTSYKSFDDCLIQIFDPVTLYLIEDISMVEFILINYADALIDQLGLGFLPKPGVYDMLWRLGRMRHKGSSLDMIRNIRSLSQAVSTTAEGPALIASFFTMLTEFEYPSYDVDERIPINPGKVTYIASKGLGLHNQTTYAPFEYCTLALADPRQAPVVTICLLLTSNKIVMYNYLFGVFDHKSVINVGLYEMIDAVSVYIQRGVLSDKGRSVNRKYASGDSNLNVDELLMLANINLGHYLGLVAPYRLDDIASAYNKLYYKAYPVDTTSYRWKIYTTNNPPTAGVLQIRDNKEYVYVYGDDTNHSSYTFEDLDDQISGDKKMSLPIGITDVNYWNKQSLFPLAEEIRIADLKEAKPNILKCAIYSLPPSRDADDTINKVLDSLRGISTLYRNREKSEYSTEELRGMIDGLRDIGIASQEFLSTYSGDKCSNLLDYIRRFVTKIDEGVNPYAEFKIIENIINAFK